MPSQVALKLVQECKKCTIMNTEQLTSFGLFNMDILCLYVIGVPINDTTCFSSNSDVKDILEMGLLAFVLLLTLVTLNVPNII